MSEAKKDESDLSDLLYDNDKGDRYVVRSEHQEFFKMENGLYLIPASQDIELLRKALAYAMSEADMGGSRETPAWISELDV